MNINLNPPTLIALMLIVIIALQLYKIYQNRKRKQRQWDYSVNKNTRITNQNIRMGKIEREINDRLDKLEVDVTFMKEFTFKAETINLDRKLFPPSSHKIKSKKIKSPLIDLLKEKKPTKKRTLKYSDKEIDKEMRRKLGKILFLDRDELANEQKKAYARLWARDKYKQDKKTI